MKLQIQYLTNESGNPTAVQIPIKEWNRYKKKFSEYENLVRFKIGLRNAFEEFEEIKKGEKKAVTLTEFLDEL